MPAGGSGSSYLPTMGMGRRSFAYRRLKKLPPAPAPPAATTAPTATGVEHGGDPQEQAHHHPYGAAIEESYRSYYRALVARGRPRRQRRRPRRLRAWGALARALRRRAAAAGARVRASVAKVARRLREARPYVGDLFAGNYMFLQVAPAPTMDARAGAVAPFAEYYYGCKARSRAADGTGAGAGAVQLRPAAAAGVLYKV